MPHNKERDSRLEIRPLTLEDYDEVSLLQRACFPGVDPWSKDDLAAQIRRFPEGQIGIELDGKLVATSSSLIVLGDDWQNLHDFDEVTTNGTIEEHDDEGDTLYGTDIAVSPEHRNQRLARRIYEYRKELMRRYNLRRLFIAGRLPGLATHPELTPEEYVRLVVAKELVDPTLNAQLAQGFAIRRVLRDYLPGDVESRGCAVLMEWINPEWAPEDLNVKLGARVAAVQYRMRLITSFNEFADQCSYFANIASDYRTDFLLFPELLTNQLIPLIERQRPALRVRALHSYTERYIEMFSKLAIHHNVNIIGGTHLEVEDDQLYNVAYLFHRTGASTNSTRSTSRPPRRAGGASRRATASTSSILTAGASRS